MEHTELDHALRKSMWAVTEDRIEAERRIFGPGPEGERGVEIPLQ